MNAPSDPDRLSTVLADWRLRPSRHPQFRAAVWQRVTLSGSEPGWFGYVRAHGALVAGVLAVAVVFGAWRGREQARERAVVERDALVTEYVRGLDARAMRSH